MEAPTGISFTSLTVNQLKEFLNERGVTVASNMNKQNLVCLCEAAKNLNRDPNLQNCNSWRVIKKENWLILAFLKIRCYFTICLHLCHLIFQNLV